MVGRFKYQCQAGSCLGVDVKRLPGWLSSIGIIVKQVVKWLHCLGIKCLAGTWVTECHADTWVDKWYMYILPPIQLVLQFCLSGLMPNQVIK